MYRKTVVNCLPREIFLTVKNQLNGVNDLFHYHSQFSSPIGEKILDEVGSEIRRKGYLTYDQLLEISDWKAGRRNRRNVRKNKPQRVVEITKNALSFDDDESRIKTLCWPNLNGVRVPVASTILTFYDPEKYGVIDQHTSRSLYRNRSVLEEVCGPSRFFEKKKLTGFTVRDYLEYLRIIRKVVKILSKNIGKHFTARDVDRALWQEDKENGGKLS